MRALKVSSLLFQAILVNFSLVDLWAKLWFDWLLFEAIFSDEICLDVMKNNRLSSTLTAMKWRLHIMLHLVGCLITHVGTSNMKVRLRKPEFLSCNLTHIGRLNASKRLVNRLRISLIKQRSRFIRNVCCYNWSAWNSRSKFSDSFFATFFILIFPWNLITGILDCE